MCLLILRLLHWLRQQINILSNMHSILDTIFIQQAYHIDDSPKVHNSNITMNITIRSKISSFVLEHLASYMLARLLQQKLLSIGLCASQYAHMHTK